jgi:hypothetical protein
MRAILTARPRNQRPHSASLNKPTATCAVATVVLMLLLLPFPMARAAIWGSDWVNGWDGYVNMDCGGGAAFIGFQSYHVNRYVLRGCGTLQCCFMLSPPAHSAPVADNCPTATRTVCGRCGKHVNGKGSRFTTLLCSSS